MMLEKDDFKRAAGVSEALALEWSMVFSLACAEFDINTPERLAMFIATCGHESGGFKHVREIWGPTEAQKRYEGRADLGNTQPGDGSRFRGRGLIQTTGRSNYQKVSKALEVDFLANPEKLEEPENAARSAGYFWKSNGLNEIADTGDLLKTQKRVNGFNRSTGLPNGWEDRQKRYAVAKEALEA